MRSLVVYDSVFGNTAKIAQAIGEGLALSGEVTILSVADANLTLLTGVDVLAVGSPTRAFKATPATDAFLKSIPPGSLKGIKVVGFDTRVNIAAVNSRFLTIMVGIFGYAAKPIAERLVRKGGTLAKAPEGFFITDKEGPLQEGELDRARAWGADLR